jgi:YcxB-like protein
MEIKTQITKADLVEFHLFHNLRSGGSRLRFFSWALLPPVIPTAALFGLSAGHLGRPVRVSFLLLIPLYFALFYYFTRRRLARQLETPVSSVRAESELGDHVIDVEEQGVRLNDGSENVFLNWAQIPRVLVHNSYGYIYTSPDRAIIIPERCFSDSNAFTLFMKVAVIYHWNVQRAGVQQHEPAPAAGEATTQQTGTSPMPAAQSHAPIAFVSR